MEHTQLRAIPGGKVSGKTILILLVLSIMGQFLLAATLSELLSQMRLMDHALCDLRHFLKRKPMGVPVSSYTGTVRLTPEPLPMDASAPMAQTD